MQLLNELSAAVAHLINERGNPPDLLRAQQMFLGALGLSHGADSQLKYGWALAKVRVMAGLQTANDWSQEFPTEATFYRNSHPRTRRAEIRVPLSCAR